MIPELFSHYDYGLETLEAPPTSFNFSVVSFFRKDTTFYFVNMDLH